MEILSASDLCSISYLVTYCTTMVHSRLHDCFFIDVCKLIGRNKRDRIDVVHDKVDKVDFHLRLDIDD